MPYTKFAFKIHFILMAHVSEGNKCVSLWTAHLSKEVLHRSMHRLFCILNQKEAFFCIKPKVYWMHLHSNLKLILQNWLNLHIAELWAFMRWFDLLSICLTHIYSNCSNPSAIVMHRKHNFPSVDVHLVTILGAIYYR